MKTIKFILIFLLIQNCIFARPNCSDSITIICIFRTPHKPEKSYLIPTIEVWKRDFSKSLLINSTTKINDSTWKLKIPVPGNPFNQLFSLNIIGPSYEIFFNSKVEKETIFIDTTYSERKPYILKPLNKDNFSFGIDWQNTLRDYPIPTDSTSNANQIARILQEAGKIKYRYRKEIEKDEVFKAFVKIQILRSLYDNLREPYLSTAAGQLLKDSLKRELLSVLQKPTIYSFNSTRLGIFLLDNTKQGDKSIAGKRISLMKYIFKTIPSGLYRDYLIECTFVGATYDPKIQEEDVVELFGYAKPRIRDPGLNHSLQNEYQRYKNERQHLPNTVLLKTQLISPYNTKPMSMKQLITSLKIKGKKKLVIDFWASWCGPCKQEITESREFIDSLQKVDTSLAYIYFSIDVPKDYSIAKDFIRQQHIRENVFFIKGARESTIYNYFKIDAIPYHVLLDVNTLRFKANIPGPSWLKSEFLDILKEDIR